VDRWTIGEERAKRNVQWRESTLFFGLSRQTGGNGTGDEQISDAEFDHFIARVVTPLFPDGRTILDAHGCVSCRTVCVCGVCVCVLTCVSCRVRWCAGSTSTTTGRW
jgi:hypothetical protein